MYGVSGRKKEAKHKRNEKNLGENWQMNWKKKCLSREYFDKSRRNKRFAPTTNVVVLYYNLFEMPIWYGIEFLLRFRCKSSTPNERPMEIMCRGDNLNASNLNDDSKNVRWRQTKGISTQDGIVGSEKKFLCFYQTSRTQRKSQIFGCSFISCASPRVRRKLPWKYLEP